MLKKTSFFIAGLLIANALTGAENGSQIFEAEKVLAPGIVMPVNKQGGSWMLWTQDPNRKIWSQQAVIQFGKAAEEGAVPGKTGRELRVIIPVAKSGDYDLKVRNFRNLGFSADGGKSWKNIFDGGTIFSNRYLKAGEKIEVIVSPCFVSTRNKGVAYLDYFELLPSKPEDLNNAGFTGKIKNQAPRGWSVYSAGGRFISGKYNNGTALLTVTKTTFWTFTNWAEFTSVPGRVHTISADVKNCGKSPITVTLQFIGLNGKKVVNHNVRSAKIQLAPGESKSGTVSAASPENIEKLSFRFVGPGNSETEIRNVRYSSVQREVKKPAPVVEEKEIPAPEGRFEAENVLAPGYKVPADTFEQGKWTLWTKDPNKIAWSGKKTLYFCKKVLEDSTPGKTGEELKFNIPVKKDGFYTLSAKTMRNVGFSVDGGKKWMNSGNVSHLFFNRKLKAGDVVTVLASPCYTTPRNPGVVYIDCFDLVPAKAPELANLAFEGEVVNDTIPGWVCGSYTRERSKLAMLPGGKAVIETGNVGFCTFTNRNHLYGSTGDSFVVRGTVTNLGKRSAQMQIQFTGWRGNAEVNPAVNTEAQKIAPGKSFDFFLPAAVSAECDSIRFRFVIGNNSKFEIKNLRMEFKGNLSDVADKCNFQFAKDGKLQYVAENASIELIDNGRSLKISAPEGQKWSLRCSELRPALNGEGLNVRYSARALSNDAAVRFRLKAIYNDQQSRLSLSPMDWHKVTDKVQKFCEKAYVMSFQCDTLEAAFDGKGSMILSNISAERVQEPVWDKPLYRKVPIPDYPPRKAKLGRGVIVKPFEKNKAYVSWRLTAGDPENIAFDVFSKVGGKEVKLNSSPIVQTTDFIVENPVDDALYIVRPAAGFKGASGSAKADKLPYRVYKVADPQDFIWSVAPADLDGDGEFDYVARTCRTNIDPVLYNNVKNAPHFRINAVHRDGRLLWSNDLGPNIEAGVWFSVLASADLDGDGKAEVITKGSMPEDGDLREAGGVAFNTGRVLSGPEYILVFDGMTGKLIASAPWPDRQPYYALGFYAHRSFGRNQLAIFRPDGKTNCILALRGTYSFMQAEAWKLENGKLVNLWKYHNLGLGQKWWKQGSHQTRIADVDKDGRDEVILGAALLDDDGSPLWSTGHGHPDYVFVADVTKRNPGLEVVTLYEDKGERGGITCADAATGKVVWELEKPHQHFHYGYACDMDARFRGWEVGGYDLIGKNSSDYHYSPDGELIGFNETAPYTKYALQLPHFAYWDADLQKELIEFRMLDHRGGDSGGPDIRGAYCGQFDSEGDWREEIAVRAGLGEFHIYSTDIPAMDRRVTFMEDDIYRHAVISNASGYIMDLSMGVLPTDTAVNLNMTVLKDKADTLEIAVSAPLDKGAAGKLNITAPSGVTVEPASFDIALKAGEIKVMQAKLSNPAKSREYIRGEWKLADGRVLKGQVPAASVVVQYKIPPVTGIYAEAEDFVAESGGEVYRRSDKGGVSRRCISHWDKKGHRLTWEMNVPEKGRYRLMIRYCSGVSVKRKLSCNGKDHGVIDMPATGGIFGGRYPYEWQSCKLAELDLEAGKVRVELENTDGRSCNTDYLKLEKAE